MIAGLKGINPNGKRQQPNQQQSKSSGKEFAKVLDKAKEEERRKSVTVYTNGYTRSALPFYNFITSREYN